MTLPLPFAGKFYCIYVTFSESGDGSVSLGSVSLASVESLSLSLLVELVAHSSCLFHGTCAIVFSSGCQGISLVRLNTTDSNLA